MRIVRYPLEIVDYQQLQPLWPGRILSVGIGRDVCADGITPTLDMWAVDNDAHRGERLPPVLGVWVVGTGNDIDERMFVEHDALFHGTVDMRYVGHGAWHVFSAVVGTAAAPEPVERPQYGSVDAMVERIKARRRG